MSLGLVAPSAVDLGDPVLQRLLTRDRHKWALYAQEPGFGAALARLVGGLGPTVLDTLRRIGIVLAKPEVFLEDCFAEITDFLHHQGFDVVDHFPTSLSPLVCREVWRYQWNAATVERIEVSELVLGLGLAHGLVVTHADHSAGGASTVADRLAGLKGPSDPDRQRPGHLRHALGASNRVLSYVHVPDEPADIVRDLSLLLGRRDLVALLARAMASLEATRSWEVDELEGVARLTDAPPERPAAPLTGTLARRVRQMEQAVSRLCRADGTYRIPRPVWAQLVGLCAQIAAQPDVGRKRIGSAADTSDTPPERRPRP